jgi:PKHD-type hydroxylase
MMLHLPNVLTSDQLTEIRQHLHQATWQNGALSAGQQAAQRKHNLQLDSRSPATQPLAEMVRAALMQQPCLSQRYYPNKC